VKKSAVFGLLIVLLALAGIPALAAPRPQQTDVVAGNNAFAFELYQASRDQNENIILSPYSVSTALAMTYAGARGETESQMADVLHFTLPQEELHTALGDLSAQLNSGEGEEEGDLQLHIANALWAQEEYPFRQDYTDLVQSSYDAGLQTLNFEADPEASRQTINDWVSEATEDRINDLLGPDTITDRTRLVLTNAIYFKAQWASQFEEEATQDGPFTLSDGSDVTVPMMHQTENFGYLQGDGFQAVELPYVDNTAAMLVLLPDEGQFDTFEGALTAEQFDSIRGSLEYKQVALQLPRFSYEASFDLVPPLQSLGMTDAFTDAADFSGMSDESLLISAILHKAFVLVDENGTEAAAATAVVMEVTAAPADMPVEMTVDRPFLYVIYDQTSGAILFMGRVLNPAS
jgi:serpin B